MAKTKQQESNVDAEKYPKVKGNYCFVCSDGTEFSDMYFASIYESKSKK
ncbi:MAG: hypothetical protein ACOXZH_07405 [Bacteroidales bacterium]